jgi:hypothetical protein
MLFYGGLWYDKADPRYHRYGPSYEEEPSEYGDEHRLLQFQRLDGLGQPPSLEERAKLKWPQHEWWADRDRIVLLCEYIRHLDDYPPPEVEELGGWPHDDPRRERGWIDCVDGRALRLWVGEQVNGEFWVGKAGVHSPTAILAGYRYLTSFPSCPRTMRLPMHPDIFARHTTLPGCFAAVSEDMPSEL